MKKVYIIHGWSGSPKEPMLAWIALQLQEKGYEVIAPEMPDPDAPVIATWVEKVASVAENLDIETVFIGHSVGCQTILRYLETIPEMVKVGKIILIAPWITSINLDPDESPSIARPWIETPIDYEKVLSHTNDITCFLSTDDPYVAFEENKKFCEEKLHAKTIVLENKGHFSEGEGNAKDLPELLGVI